MEVVADVPGDDSLTAHKVGDWEAMRWLGEHKSGRRYFCPCRFCEVKAALQGCWQNATSAWSCSRSHQGGAEAECVFGGGMAHMGPQKGCAGGVGGRIYGNRVQLCRSGSVVAAWLELCLVYQAMHTQWVADWGPGNTELLIFFY